MGQKLGRYEEAADLGFENRSGPVDCVQVKAFDQIALRGECGNTVAVLHQEQVVADRDVIVEEDPRLRTTGEAVEGLERVGGAPRP